MSDVFYVCLLLYVLHTWCGWLQVSGLRQVAVSTEAEALALFFEVRRSTLPGTKQELLVLQPCACSAQCFVICQRLLNSVAATMQIA
jgi:hypothetical protein